MKTETIIEDPEGNPLTENFQQDPINEDPNEDSITLNSIY